MKFFNGMILGILIGAIGFWYFQDKARQHPAAEERYEASASRAGAAANEAAHNMSDAFKAKIETLDLSADQVRDEMARSGKIVRRRAKEIAGKVADAASDARVVTEIKAKYAADPDLSVWSISVSCHDGHVVLEGTAPTPEGVAKAITLALEVDGVEDVSSTVALKPK